MKLDEETYTNTCVRCECVRFCAKWWNCDDDDDDDNESFAMHIHTHIKFKRTVTKKWIIMIITIWRRSSSRRRTVESCATWMKWLKNVQRKMEGKELLISFLRLLQNILIVGLLLGWLSQALPSNVACTRSLARSLFEHSIHVFLLFGCVHRFRFLTNCNLFRCFAIASSVFSSQTESLPAPWLVCEHAFCHFFLGTF